MIALSAAWLDQEKGTRNLLSKVPLVGALVPRLEAAHASLVAHAMQARAPALPATLEAIREEESRIDLRHDKKARGVYLALSALTELAETNEEASRIVDLRELLFPSGTSIITRSYLEEAGEARLVRDRVDSKTRSLLSSLPSLHGRTLADEVDAWMEAGDALGALEQRRSAAEDAKSARASEGAPRAIHHARRSWIRVVTALIDNLALEDEIDLELERAVLAPLREAESNADRRAVFKASTMRRATEHRKKPAAKKAPAKKAPAKKTRASSR